MNNKIPDSHYYCRSGKSHVAIIGVITLVILIVLIGLFFQKALKKKSFEHSKSKTNTSNTLTLLCPSGKVRSLAMKAIEDFEAKNSGWTVTLISCSGKDYYVKCLSMLAAGVPVDMLWLGMGFGMFADRNVLLPIDSFMADDADVNRSDFTPQSLTMYTLRGKLYGLPYGLDFEVIAINENLFRSEGVSIPDDRWTLTDMIQLARKMNRTEPGSKRIYGLGMSAIPLGFWGLSILSNDGQAFALNNREGLQRLKLNIELADEGVLLRSEGTGQIDRLNEFISGKVAIMRVYSWEIPDLRRMARFQWKLLPLPHLPMDSQRAWASSSGFCIAANSEHPAAAWKLLKELSSAKFQSAQMENMFPTRTALLPQYQASLDEREKAILQVLPMLAPDPRIKTMEKIASEYDYWNSQAMLKQLSPEEALETAAKRINRILKSEESSPKASSHQ